MIRTSVDHGTAFNSRVPDIHFDCFGKVCLASNSLTRDADGDTMSTVRCTRHDVIDGNWSKGQVGRARPHRPVAHGLDAILKEDRLCELFQQRNGAAHALWEFRALGGFD